MFGNKGNIIIGLWQTKVQCKGNGDYRISRS